MINIAFTIIKKKKKGYFSATTVWGKQDQDTSDHKVREEHHSRPKPAPAVAGNCGCYRIARALSRCGT